MSASSIIRVYVYGTETANKKFIQTNKRALNGGKPY